MAKKMFVRAQARAGYPGIYRGGRLWDGNKDVEVEVVDSDEDPEQEAGQPHRIGKRTLKALEDDGRFSLRDQPSQDSGDSEALKAELETLRVENTRLMRELEEARSQLEGRSSSDGAGEPGPQTNAAAPLPFLGGDEIHKADVKEDAQAHKGKHKR